MKNEEYRQEKKKSKFGQLVAGTSYEKYAINNEFILDNNNFIEKKHGSSRFSFAFIYENEIYGVWFDYTEGKIFVSNDYNKNTPYLFSFTLKDHTPNTLMISSIKNYKSWKNFIENFKMGNVYFENQKIKHVTNNLLKMVLSLK